MYTLLSELFMDIEVMPTFIQQITEIITLVINQVREQWTKKLQQILKGKRVQKYLSNSKLQEFLKSHPSWKAISSLSESTTVEVSFELM